MAISLGLLVGIIAGAVCLTFLSVVLVVLGLRYNHKRHLSRINSAGERRLGGFAPSPSAIMSITDEDVARMPGTRASVRRSSQTPFSRNSLYTPMASRESIPRRAYIPKARTNDRNDHEPVTSQQSWPLPRRMTRADGTPLVKMPLSTLTPVTERSKNAGHSPPHKDTIDAVGTQQKDAIRSNVSLDLNGGDGDVPNASSSKDLTPKPLFHGQQRSSSYGMIDVLADGSKTEPRASRRMSQFPRSKSMYTQDPGLAPPQPLPPLPFELTSKRSSRIKSPDLSVRRVSGASLFSEQTSILDENWPKAFSQTGTDFTSITLASPTKSTSTARGDGKYNGNHIGWEASYEQGRASPVGPAKQMLFRPQLNTQRSFRASIQESLPRSKSSGLSLSMSLHGPSRAESRASLAKDPSSTHSRSRVTIPRSTEKRKSKRGNSPSSPLRHATDFNIHDDTKSKRASTSTLHEISGNDGSPIPSPWDKRPRSIATSHLLEWDIESPTAAKSPAPNGRVDRDERQSRIPISNIPITIPSAAKPSAIEKQNGPPQADPRPRNPNPETRSQQPTFRPPSRQEFDFALQTSLGLHSPNPQTTTNNNNSPFSPTQFMMNLYREESRSPDPALDTPTRKPSSRRPSSLHPNRRRTIFDEPTPLLWPPAAPSPSHHPDPDPDPDPKKPTPATSRQSQQSISQTSSPSSSRPPSFLLNYPWPQPPHPSTPHRRPGGPRAPPFRYISPNRRSPIKAGVGKRSASPVKDLRRSVAALRRMNSEVVSSVGRRSREHRRYLSIGEGEGGVILEERGEGEGSRAGSRGFVEKGGLRSPDGKENVRETREVRILGGMAKLGPLGGGGYKLEKSPSGSVYDGEGFLEELDAWLR